MTFTRPEMLFIVWAVPILLIISIYGFRRRHQILSRFASDRSLKSITIKRSPVKAWIKVGLILWAVLFLILALSGPQYGYKWIETEGKGVDIIIALDCSKSMLATDIKPSRLARAKREIIDLLNMLEGDRVGLVAFAGTAFLQCPLTLDYEAFYIFLDTLSPNFLPMGGTNITAALREAKTGFKLKDNTKKAVILITDGESTLGNPIEEAQEMAKSDIKLFCIGVGKESGVPVPDDKKGLRKDSAGNIVVTKLDEDTLKKIAKITKGAYVRSISDDRDLKTIYFQEIRDKMALKTFQSGRKKVNEDRYQWFLLIAVLFCLIELFLKERTKGLLIIITGLIIFSPGLQCHAASAYHLMQKGVAAYEAKDYEKALKRFIAAQLEEPDNAEILYNLGNAHYKLGDYKSARDHYIQAAKTEKTKIQHKAQYNAGNASFRLEDLSDAIALYEKALTLDPNDVKARENLEFAKKKLQEKKERQKKQEKNQDSSKPDTKDEKNPQDNQEGQEKQQQDDSSNSKFGKEMKAPTKPESDNNQDKEEKGDKEKKSKNHDNKDNKGQPNQVKGKNPDDQSEKNQAEALLNRLHDKPGKAMIPFYEKKVIEKDW